VKTKPQSWQRKSRHVRLPFAKEKVFVCFVDRSVIGRRTADAATSLHVRHLLAVSAFFSFDHDRLARHEILPFDGHKRVQRANQLALLRREWRLSPLSLPGAPEVIVAHWSSQLLRSTTALVTQCVLLAPPIRMQLAGGARLYTLDAES
jgi:hypothetical protein